MFRRLLSVLSVVAVMTAGISSSLPAHAADEVAKEPAKSAFTDAQRSELNAMMKQFILDNPQALITSVETYYNKQNDQKKAQEGAMDQIPAGLYDDARSPSIGPKDAKFTIVEFFDYNCGFCKQVAPDVERLMKEEKNIRFIFKELPILSDMSEVAARYALAANIQGKYIEYHNALMAHQGPLDPTFLQNAAKDVGLDVNKLRADADTQDIRDALTKNVELARTLGVRGTPFFLFGKSKVPGAVGYTRMKEIIAQERDGVTTPAAPAPEPAAAAPSASDNGAATTTTTTTSDYSPSTDPDIKQAVEDAKKETGDMLNDLKKQADDMKKQAEELLKQQKELEAAKKANAAAPVAKK